MILVRVFVGGNDTVEFEYEAPYALVPQIGDTLYTDEASFQVEDRELPTEFGERAYVDLFVEGV